MRAALRTGRSQEPLCFLKIAPNAKENRAASQMAAPEHDYQNCLYNV